MTESARTEARVRSAMHEYMCESAPDTVCNKTIRAGDLYFAFTLISPGGYRTRRYCLDCARIAHGALLEQSLNKIRRPSKLKQARKKIAQSKYLGIVAGTLKKEMTPSETFFWEFLSARPLGVKFYKQAVVHGFVVDFWCPARKLAVELDGKNHLARKEKDQQRDNTLLSYGIRVLRFPSALVYHDAEFVVSVIREAIQKTDGMIKNNRGGKLP